MGTSQSSLAKSSSMEAKEHEQTIGVRGHEMESEIASMIVLEAIEKVESADVMEELSDESEEDTDDESEEEEEEDLEYERILSDLSMLKKLAVDYAHPETGVTQVDGAAFGRNYFTRPSAVEQESVEEAEERAQVLADASALKKLAVDYAHPEIGVTSVDGAAFGRNYFTRSSAVEQESVEEAEERAQVLADAIALKKLAVDYAHPEIGVTQVDGAAFGRNYFTRSSAIEQESVEEAEERAQVLADAIALKKLAVDYAHPEIGVTSVDGAAFGRNYFTRPSAVHQESKVSSKKPVEVILPVKVSLPRNNKIKTIDQTKDTRVKKSPSSVLLYGLDGNDSSAF